MDLSNEFEFASVCSAIVVEIGARLIEKHASASSAESLTGGLLASEIVRVPGVSEWFREGCVTYSDGAKEARLGVDPAVIRAHTAVSRPVARAMAEGMRITSGADVSVSTTGLAGPGPDEFGRPAGLVFIGGAINSGSVTRELKLSGTRMEIRRQTVYEALKLMNELTKIL